MCYTSVVPSTYEMVKRSVQKKKDAINKIKEASPCTDCGIKYPYYVMDFDHIRDKSFGISKMSWRSSLKNIMAEIDKCELVCSNCHRIRTQARRIAAE